MKHEILWPHKRTSSIFFLKKRSSEETLLVTLWLIYIYSSRLGTLHGPIRKSGCSTTFLCPNSAI